LNTNCTKCKYDAKVVTEDGHQILDLLSFELIKYWNLVYIEIEGMKDTLKGIIESDFANQS